MQKRIIQAGLAGMNQDVINPKVNLQYAYEIKNFRINSTGHSNGIELTSEKGTRQIPILYGDLEYDNIGEVAQQIDNIKSGTFEYNIIGHCVLNEYLTVFVHGVNTEDNTVVNDKIIRLELINHTSLGWCFNAVLLYEGNLGFDNDHKIECIPCMESVDIQKIYWIDGKNYPRVINIVKEGGYTDFDEDEDPFSFYQKISVGDYNNIQVEKTYVGGLFYAGVVQYAFSFYNRNAQETPIIYTTPLNYISHSDRGEAPNKQLGCAFEVTVNINPEDKDNFEYVRVYSIYRSSINGTPIVKVIKDAKCEDFKNNMSYYSITFTDTNEQGYDFDAYRILVESDLIRPNAIAYKDLKMFLGNYNSDIKIQDANKYALDETQDVNWVTGETKYVCVNSDDIEFYPYVIQTTNDSNTVKTFKHGEHYKLGFQLLDKYGKWGLIFFYKDSENTKYPELSGNNCYLPYAESQQSISDIFGNEDLSDYVRIRTVVSSPTYGERSILCLGILNPTVFNAGLRNNKTCIALASWFFRPFSSNIDQSNDHNVGFVQNKHDYPLFNSTDFRSELLNMYFDVTNTQGNTIPATVGYESSTEFEEGTLSLPPFGDSDMTYLGLDYTIGNISNICYKYGISEEPARIVTTEYIYQDGQLIGFHYTVEVYSFEGSIDWSDPESSDVGNIMSIQTLDYYYLTEDYTPSSDSGERPMITYTLAKQSGTLDKYNSFYYVDQQFVTLNSPDIEFDENLKNIDLSQYDIRIIGRVDFKNVAAKYQVIAESPLFINNGKILDNGEKLIRSSLMAHGFYDKLHNYYTESQYTGGRMLSTGQVWLDDICNIFTYEDLVGCGWNAKELELLYFTYPWQRQHLNNFNGNNYVKAGSSNNSKAGITEESETSKIIKKILSNNRYCDTVYDDEYSDIGHDSMKLFSSNESIIMKLGDQEFYQGNVDQLVSCTSQYMGWKFDYLDGDDYDATSSSANTVHWIYGKKTGYPIVIGKRIYSGKYDHNTHGYYTDIDSINDGLYGRVLNNGSGVVGIRDCTPSDHSQDPILMRYKSTPHIICKLKQQLLESGKHESSTNGYLYLAEIYRDNTCSSNDIFELLSRTWTPCSKPINLFDQQGNLSTEKLVWTEGDTYFQRYDCLKTYPYSNDDYQSVVEIASFMVETRINLDGRYDLNRGLADNTFINPTNFNLINTVYNQNNNFFQYNILDQEHFKTNDFPTRFTWSLNKVNGLEIDEWTRTNTAAFYDCDGDKGMLTSLRRFNGQIYAFQDKGISRIKYNENVAINTQNGTPIELGNSMSVNGVEYLSELVGSQNKWSNISTPNGIFFVDNYTPGIYRLGGGERILTNLTKNTLQRWFESNNENHDFIRTASFDANMNDVMFMYGDNESIAYNCDFGVFSSFYDYKGMIGNIKNHSFNIEGNNIHFLREGKQYNSFYGQKKPYWISFVANSNIDGFSPSNALYDNVWYKADVLHSTKNDNFNYDELIQDILETIPDFSNNTGWYETFNKIVVGNDYQYAENKNQTKNFDFIKKFRTWRVPVPRQDRARMRNSWLRIRLENTKPSYDKMVLRDIYVDSFF